MTSRTPPPTLPRFRGDHPAGPTISLPAPETCASVSRGCPWASSGDRKRYAPPVSLFSWHGGNCGPFHARPHSPKRDLAQQRHSYYRNATAQDAVLKQATAPSAPRADLVAQLASGMLPSPCNTSYASFAWGDSPNGIVHESPENRLGALLPPDAKTLPPVPERVLRLHEGKEGDVNVVVE